MGPELEGGRGGGGVRKRVLDGGKGWLLVGGEGEGKGGRAGQGVGLPVGGAVFVGFGESAGVEGGGGVDGACCHGEGEGEGELGDGERHCDWLWWVLSFRGWILMKVLLVGVESWLL